MGCFGGPYYTHDVETGTHKLLIIIGKVHVPSACRSPVPYQAHIYMYIYHIYIVYMWYSQTADHHWKGPTCHPPAGRLCLGPPAPLVAPHAARAAGTPPLRTTKFEGKKGRELSGEYHQVEGEKGGGGGSNAGLVSVHPYMSRSFSAHLLSYLYKPSIYVYFTDSNWRNDSTVGAIFENPS